MGQQQVKVFEFLSATFHFLLIFGFFVEPTVQQTNNSCKNIKHLDPRQNLFVYNISSGECRQTFEAPQNKYISVSCSLRSENCQDNRIFFYDDIHGNAELLCGKFHRKSFLNTIQLMLDSKHGDAVCTMRLVVSDTCFCGWHDDSTGVDERLQNPSAINIWKKLTNDVYNFGSQLICTGAIISHFFILTSVTCVADIDSPKYMYAVTNDKAYGHEDNNIYNIAKILKHPEYNPQTKVYDITILETEISFQWTRRVGPICLPTLQYAFPGYEHLNITVHDVNRAKTKYELRTESVEIYPYMYNNNCTTSVSQFYIKFGMNQDRVCALGGPVTLNAKFNQTILLGITGKNDDCGGPKKVRVGTYTIASLPWIYYETKALICQSYK